MWRLITNFSHVLLFELSVSLIRLPSNWRFGPHANLKKTDLVRYVQGFLRFKQYTVQSESRPFVFVSQRTTRRGARQSHLRSSESEGVYRSHRRSRHRQNDHARMPARPPHGPS